jgi:YHS domain-containing protein
MTERIQVRSHSSRAIGSSEGQLDSLKTVCQRIIQGDQAFFPQAEFHGQTVYFCTEACQMVFLSDPERFINAHEKRRP